MVGLKSAQGSSTKKPTSLITSIPLDTLNQSTELIQCIYGTKKTHTKAILFNFKSITTKIQSRKDLSDCLTNNSIESKKGHKNGENFMRIY
ncbi:hypothetical protein Lmor_2007 [Legionella moravica]|uniref:Uncharacterized protein n=1 Tax=Legionella moravica TaxID=39962 RepID=A0A378JXS1_9GAMM|nr:hypothetical protein Lmor_2007 [Legionella moravica]STX61829.1 Uncharacterised protein [Legionella moravica]